MGSSLSPVILLVSIAMFWFSFPAPFKKNQGNVAAKSRHARNLVQFGNMIACSTNQSMWDYSDYGCWCGYGGSGKPVDATDRCCYEHDLCYKSLDFCQGWWFTFFTNYRYTECRQCEPEFTYSADDEQKKCKTALCECDSQAAKCFGEAYFNKSYAIYDTSKC
ncbi:acidic phospholipase A2 Cc1-PLA2-like [Montipora capricornis]|uniref:acidic phospholipase A2 Cc1-PLA2-like n=1 Tax=Montipora capricornis TaxID=246305 RepID=UPI0035F1A0C1